MRLFPLIGEIILGIFFCAMVFKLLFYKDPQIENKPPTKLPDVAAESKQIDESDEDLPKDVL